MIEKTDLYNEIKELNAKATEHLKQKEFEQTIRMLVKVKPLMIKNNDEFKRFLRLPNTYQKAGMYQQALEELEALNDVIKQLVAQYSHPNYPLDVVLVQKQYLAACYDFELKNKRAQLAKREHDDNHAKYEQEALIAEQHKEKIRVLSDKAREAYYDQIREKRDQCKAARQQETNNQNKPSSLFGRLFGKL